MMTDRQRLLELALKGLEAERTKIDGEIAQLRSQLRSQRNGSEIATTTETGSAPRKRRTMSAEARKRISEGMKRRYAELRKAVKK
jgi:hypothetical protein